MTNEGTIGDAVRKARERLGWTQGQLAERIGVTASFITKVEKNEAIPSYDRLVGLASVLVLDANVLITLSEEGKEHRAQQRLRTRGAVARSAYGIEQSGGTDEPPRQERDDNTAERLGREILDDPDLQLAFTWLRTIIADPELRSVVLKTLEALAKQSTNP